MTFTHVDQAYPLESEVARNFAYTKASECGSWYREDWVCTRTAGHGGRHEACYLDGHYLHLCGYWDDEA